MGLQRLGKLSTKGGMWDLVLPQELTDTFFTLYALETERLEGLNERNNFYKVEKHAIEKAQIMALSRRR
jgi:hypothetical protein